MRAKRDARGAACAIGPADSAAKRVIAALTRLHLLERGEQPTLQRLTGGISSEVFRVELRCGPVCTKRALPRLNVAGVWRAPIGRNAYEVLWLRRAREVVGERVPAVLAEDRRAGLFVMPYLPPDRFSVWKQLLVAGKAQVTTARAVGKLMGEIHAHTAGDRVAEAAFSGAAALFDKLRLQPYFVTAAAANPSCASVLLELAERTAATRIALVHGDFSPKNILIGPHGPVLLDAEACCFGDPAFDLAFCLSHLMLKCFWKPAARARYLRCFDALIATYIAAVGWEPRAALAARTSDLLPALLLARVDGKSPVEYLHCEADKRAIRAFAVAALLRSDRSLSSLRTTWPVPT